MLYGPRVILRAMTQSDLPRMYEFNNSVEVELAGGGDPPFPQSIDRLLSEFGADVGRGGRDGTRFAIEADDMFIGHCGLFNFNHVSRTCELGITIGDPNYWSKHYGREAITLLLDYGFRLNNVRKVFLHVNGRNERAQKSYRACGFVEEGRLRKHIWHNGDYDDLVVMGVLHDEWKPDKSFLTPGQG